MRPLATLFVLGWTLLALPMTTAIGPVPAAALALALGLASAALVSDASPLSMTLGALGTLAFLHFWESVAPALGAGLFVLATHGPRALRGRTLGLRVAIAVGALVLGALAGTLIARFEQHPLTVRAAAALVAGLLTAAPLAIPADDRRTHALAALAAVSADGVRPLLLRAVALRRRAADCPREPLAPTVLATVEAAWTSLIDAAHARSNAAPSAAAILDERIARAVETLERLEAAADERAVRAASLDDHPLLGARDEGDRIEAEVSALAELSAR